MNTGALPSDLITIMCTTKLELQTKNNKIFLEPKITKRGCKRHLHSTCTIVFPLLERQNDKVQRQREKKWKRERKICLTQEPNGDIEQQLQAISVAERWLRGNYTTMERHSRKNTLTHSLCALLCVCMCWVQVNGLLPLRLVHEDAVHVSIFCPSHLITSPQGSQIHPHIKYQGNIKQLFNNKQTLGPCGTYPGQFHWLQNKCQT